MYLGQFWPSLPRNVGKEGPLSPDVTSQREGQNWTAMYCFFRLNIDSISILFVYQHCSTQLHNLLGR